MSYFGSIYADQELSHRAKPVYMYPVSYTHLDVYKRQAVSGVSQEQAHFLTFPANRRVMGKNIKDDHVSGCRVETLQDVYKRQRMSRGNDSMRT